MGTNISRKFNAGCRISNIEQLNSTYKFNCKHFFTIVKYPEYGFLEYDRSSIVNYIPTQIRNDNYSYCLNNYNNVYNFNVTNDKISLILYGQEGNIRTYLLQNISSDTLSIRLVFEIYGGSFITENGRELLEIETENVLSNGRYFKHSFHIKRNNSTVIPVIIIKNWNTTNYSKL